MAAVEQQILVKIRALVEGLASVQALSASVRDLNRPRGSGLRQARTDVVNLGTASNKTVKDVSALYNGVVTTARGFADGSRSVKQWTADLGNAARAIKPITDATRLLGPARSIQLPASTLGAKVAEPIVKVADPVIRVGAAVRNVAADTDKAARNAKRLADEWLNANTSVRRTLESAAALNPATNKIFQNLISGFRSNASRGVNDGNFEQALSAAIKNSAGAAFLKSPGISTSAGKAKLTTELAKVDAAGEKASKSLTQKFNGVTTTLFRLRAALVLVGAAIVAIGAAVGLFAAFKAIQLLVSEGIRFNAVIESARIGIASLVSNTYELRDANGEVLGPVEAFNESLVKAEKLERLLQKAAIDTKFEFEEILTFFNSTLVAGAGLNASTEQLASLTKDFALAAGAANINVEKTNVGIKQILTGNTTVRNDLAKVLFPGETTRQINDQLKAFREAGTLIPEIGKRLEAFRLTASTVNQSFEALSSNTQDVLKVFAALATAELFVSVKKILNEVISQIIVVESETVKLTPTFQKIADILNVIGGAVGANLLRIAKDLFGSLTRITSTLEVNRTAIVDTVRNLFSMGEHVAGIVADFASMLFYVSGVNLATKNVEGSTGGIALSLATIRDAVRTVHGVLKLIAGVIQGGILLPINLVIVGLTSVTSGFDAAWEAAKRISRELKGPIISGIEDMIAGLNNASTKAELARQKLQLGRVAGEVGGTVDLPTSYNPLPTGGGSGESSAKAARRKADELRRALNSMFEALEALQLAAADRELAVAKDKNQLLLDIEQSRFDEGILSAEAFYKEKQRLELDDLAREAEILEKKKRIASNALRRQISTNLGRQATDVDVNAVQDAFRDTISGASVPADKGIADNIKEYAQTAKQLIGYNQELEQIELKRQGVINETTRSLREQARAVADQAADIEGQLADSLGLGGVADTINTAVSASKEFGKILLNTNPVSTELESVASAVNLLETVTLEDIVSLLELYGITVDSLDPRTQKWLKLLERKEAVNTFTRLTSEAENLRDALDLGITGVEFGFDQGTSTLDQALEAVKQLKDLELPGLIAKYEELQAILTQPNATSTQAELRQLELLGREIEKLKGPTLELSLIRQAADRDEAAADAKIVAIANQRRAGTLNDVEAEKAVVAVKQELIRLLEVQLAKLEAISVKTPQTLQDILDITNKIGTLRNESNAQILDLKDGIESSIGGAFESFFDSVLSGNESILTSFRRVVASMLVEIGKLIFQAFVLKQVMSLVQSALGSVFGGGGSGGLSPDLLDPGSFGFAEGGYTGAGPMLEPAGIVHRGEYVIPANRVRQIGIGWLENLRSGAFLPRRGYAVGGLVGGSGSGSGVGRARGAAVRIINNIDPSLMSDYLNSSDGEQTIVNIMSKNSQMLTRIA